MSDPLPPMIFTTNSERQQLEEIRSAEEARAHTYRRAWEARNREAPQPEAFEIARVSSLAIFHDREPLPRVNEAFDKAVSSGIREQANRRDQGEGRKRVADRSAWPKERNR